MGPDTRAHPTRASERHACPDQGECIYESCFMHVSKYVCSVHACPLCACPCLCACLWPPCPNLPLLSLCPCRVFCVVCWRARARHLGTTGSRRAPSVVPPPGSPGGGFDGLPPDGSPSGGLAWRSLASFRHLVPQEVASTAFHPMVPHRVAWRGIVHARCTLCV